MFIQSGNIFLIWGGVRFKERGRSGTRNPSIKEMLLGVFLEPSEWAKLLFVLLYNLSGNLAHMSIVMLLSFILITTQMLF